VFSYLFIWADGVQFTGAFYKEEGIDIITSELAIAGVADNNDKFTKINAMACGSTEMTGLDILSEDECYPETNCSVFYNVRQYNKKKTPDEVAVHFWIDNPDLGRGQFTMYGFITEKIDGEYTILPPKDKTVLIRFEHFRIKMSGHNSPCEVEITPFDLDEQQSMEIRLLVPPYDPNTICDELNIGENCQEL